MYTWDPPPTGGPSRSPRPRSAHGLWVALAVGFAVLLIAASVLFVVGVPRGTGSTGPPPTFPTEAARVEGPNGSAVDLDQGFLGVNVRADVALPASSEAALNATHVLLVRWPGGGDGDRFDPLADNDQGLIYSDSGSASPALTSLAQFVGWCRATGCRSIITLPGEIDDPSLVLAIVNYTEVTLGFHPTYWEFGNEPALWEHFGIPWSEWNASQASTPTALQYADLVATYTRAVRSVDPTTGIIGLGGIGGGGASGPAWISSTVSVNGPNLSGVAIHVYPAGPGFAPQDLSAWFSTLWSRSALPYRISTTVGTVRSSCPKCAVGVMVDEFQTGTLLTSATALSGGYLAAYIAAEIVQVLPLPVVSLDYYDFQSGTPGAWLNMKGSPSGAYDLYAALPTYLGPYAAQLTTSSSATGFVAAEGGASPTSLSDLWLVNTNTTYGVTINLSATFPHAAWRTAWIFNGSAGTPSTMPVAGGAENAWVVPPASVAILEGSGTSNLSGLHASSTSTVGHGGGSATGVPAPASPPTAVPTAAVRRDDRP